jgi:hypothetical protein
VFVPSVKTGKYEIDIIYDNGSETHKKIKALEKKAKQNRWGSKIPPKLLELVKDGDEKFTSDGEPCAGYPGKLFSKARSNRIPSVTDASNNIIEDPMEIKGGDLCVVLVHAYPYVNDEWNKKGVLLTLHGVRKIKDGEPLGASPIDAASELSNFEADDEFEDF